MNILIKGMSKKDFEEIIKYARYGANNCMIGERAEVVELPPHGRLIDADALIKPKNQHIDVLADEWYVTVRTIETAPTIIEAEEGET